ncbi:MAG: ATP-binding protein [Actinobacteria bacterium]|nr:ATP-binding protein [Actinomycetota bacterium]
MAGRSSSSAVEGGGGKFPFSAVVGMEEVKLALVLAAVDRRIGGVLLRGQKGSAKTTLARGLAVLLPGEAPFAELPLGASEDRLVGTLDLGAALAGEGRRFEPGLLAAAHGGVLYVDEVNLLADHLVDVLLDVATSGVNRVEREGISHQHPARFVLIGSMNPEEGELRPQLLDRFGLAVDVAASTDPGERAEAVRRRLAFDADPTGFAERWAGEEGALAARLAGARPAEVPDDLLASISALCADLGAEGLRADLVVARAAAALAGGEGRQRADAGDVRRVAPMALAHRRRRSPFEDPGVSGEEMRSALDQALDKPASGGENGTETAPVPPPEGSGGEGGGGEGEGGREQQVEAGAARPVLHLAAPPTAGDAGGRRSKVASTQGRLVRDQRPTGPVTSLAVNATVAAAAIRRADDPGSPPVVAADIREAVRESTAGNLVVLAVDCSGSMGATRRMEAATGAALGLLVDAYQRRDRVALVTFRGEGAEVVLRPTGSVEVARARLASVATGGRTPLAAGVETALGIATAGARPSGQQPLLVVLTDGRATAGPPGTDPVEAALAAGASVRRQKVPAVVVDAEDGPTRLGLAATLARAMGARHVTLDELSPGTVEAAVRQALPR